MKTKGHFQITPCLQEHHAQYLHAFARIRHAQWNEKFVRTVPDPLREAVGLPPGEEGLYMVGTPDIHFEHLKIHQPEIVKSPWSRFTPGGWCQWRPTEDQCGLEWDRGESAGDDFVEWLIFLREHFLDRWGYTLSGEVWIRDVFQECLIEANILAGETITFVVLKEEVEPESTGELEPELMEAMREYYKDINEESLQ